MRSLHAKIASDIFYFESDSYLLIVDYMSQFASIRKLSSMTGKAITHHMQAIFGWIQLAQHIGNRQQTLLHQQGVPNVNAIHVCQPHNQLSPLSPEQWTCRKFVGIIKNLFHKVKAEGQFPYTALKVYRKTPLNGSLQSPMQILQGRQAHTNLPLSHCQSKDGYQPYT